MARIRTIKPEFWGSPKTAKVSRDARLLFLGLLNESDDEGRQLGSARRIAGQVFPNDTDISTDLVDKWLEELEGAEFIRRYVVENVPYVLVIGFTEHQKVSHPSPSRLPPECFVPYLGSGSRNMDLGSEPVPPPWRNSGKTTSDFVREMAAGRPEAS